MGMFQHSTHPQRFEDYVQGVWTIVSWLVEEKEPEIGDLICFKEMLTDEDGVIQSSMFTGREVIAKVTSSKFESNFVHWYFITLGFEI